MAKKTVASLHEGSKEGRSYTKVIKMVKSPKTGAYIFDEQMVPNEKVQDFFKKYDKVAVYCIKNPLMNSLRGFFYALLGRFFSFSLLYYIFVA